MILFLDADSIVFPNLSDVIKKDFKNKKTVGDQEVDAGEKSRQKKEKIIFIL